MKQVKFGFPGILVVLCGFSSLWWPFGWNWSYLGFLGIIWRTCESKCRGEGGGIFPTLCVAFCLVSLYSQLPSVCLSVRHTFYPLAFQAEGVLSLPESVHPWTFPFPHENSSQIWPGITKFAPNMHPGILSIDIENGGHWHWPSKSFWPFRLRILGNLACLHIRYIFHLQSPNLHRICILGLSQFVFKMRFINLDLQGQLDLFNSRNCIECRSFLIYRSRPAKGYYTSQTLVHYVPNIVSLWNFQDLLPSTKVMSMQNGQGHM